MDNKKIIIVVLSLFVYFGLKWVPYGNVLLFPIQVFVTFLHEIGHAFFAILTGGSVHGIKINPTGGGYALISGGISALVIAGGYIGSAIFGNTLMYVAMKKDQKYAQNVLRILALVSILIGIFWFQSILSSLVLFATGALLGWAASKTEIAQNFLLVLGVLTVAYIIQDFSVGPGSDLQKFADIFIIIPKIVWMYAWLAGVIFITYFTWKKILKN